LGDVRIWILRYHRLPVMNVGFRACTCQIPQIKPTLVEAHTYQ